MGRLVLALTAVLVATTACGTATSLRSIAPVSKFVVYAAPSASARGSSRHVGDTIWRVRVDGTHTKRLASGNDPVLSPDGRWIAFDRGSRVFVMPARGGAAKVVYTSREKDARLSAPPIWAPDSRHIAFWKNDGILILDTVSHRSRVVRADVGYGLVADIRFSPDSRTIIYTTIIPSGLLCTGRYPCSFDYSFVASVRGGPAETSMSFPFADGERGV
jgi:Tol biopolymer transport system component